MRKKSHWHLAGYLIRENNRPAIGLMFKVGSVAPDFMIRSMIQGHSYERTAWRVEQRIMKLEERGRWNLVSAYRLGYVTHYLADYFTAPHNLHGDFGFRAHCSFEKRQLRMLRSQLDSQHHSGMSYEGQSDVMEYLKNKHEEYLEKTPEVETDCDYIIDVTEQVSHQMFALFNSRQPEVRYRRFFHHRAVM